MDLSSTNAANTEEYAMTAKKTDAPETPAAPAPDESTRTAEVAGKCNRHMTTADGALCRCYRKAAHTGDHVSATSYQRAVARAKEDRAVASAHRDASDPVRIAKREAIAAKKMATLTALAEELGFTLTKAAK
jgi:hypothetical protein